MRLPDKNEIQKQKDSERRAEIREGVKIAQQVDKIRLELLKEKDNLEKFRNETTRTVQKEIDSLILRRDGLKRETEILERHSTNLKAPFDAEWENIKKVRLSDLDRTYESVESDRIAMEADKAQISVLRNEIEKNRESTELDRKNAHKLVLDATERVKNANLIEERAKIHEAEVQSKLDAESNNIHKKAEEVALQLRDIEVREEAIKKDSAELARRDREWDEDHRKMYQSMQEKEERYDKELISIKSLKKELEEKREKIITDNMEVERLLENADKDRKMSKKERDESSERIKKISDDLIRREREMNMRDAELSERMGDLNQRERENKETYDKNVLDRMSIDRMKKELKENTDKEYDMIRNEKVRIKSVSKEIEDMLKRTMQDSTVAHFKLEESELERSHAILSKNEAEKVLENALEKERNISENIQKEKRAVRNEAKKALIRIKDAEIKEEINKEKERGIEDRERMVNDKYQTLLRTEKRIKNK